MRKKEVLVLVVLAVLLAGSAASLTQSGPASNICLIIPEVMKGNNGNTAQEKTDQYQPDSCVASNFGVPGKYGPGLT